MLYIPRRPMVICRAVGTTAGGGIVNSAANNASGTQADAALAADARAYTKWFEVLGTQLALGLNYVKGGETSIQLALEVFGADAIVQRDNDVTTDSTGTVTAVGVLNKITGTSFTLQESSMGTGGVEWTTKAFTATTIGLIPVHLGVNNRTTPATIPVSSTANCFPGMFARAVIIVAGTPNSDDPGRPGCDVVGVLIGAVSDAEAARTAGAEPRA